MGGFRGIPADLLALCVPLTFATGAFSAMLYRVIKVDPESTIGITAEDQDAVKRGNNYKNGIRNFFTGRSMSIFNNDVSFAK